MTPLTTVDRLLSPTVSVLPTPMVVLLEPAMELLPIWWWPNGPVVSGKSTTPVPFAMSCALPPVLWS